MTTPAAHTPQEALRAYDLPTLDDLAPVLLKALDEDEAMSAFQVLTQGGYRILSAAALDALVAERDKAFRDAQQLRDALAGAATVTAHRHRFVQVARFKWISGRWLRRFRCSCGAEWLGL